MRIETKRLLLRRFKTQDAAQVQELAGAFEIADTTLRIPHPYEEGMAKQWIQAQNKADSSENNFAVIRKEDHTLLGAVGLHLKAEHDHAELGYWIGKPYWGRGYASEAAASVLRFAFEDLKLNRVHAHHFARNPASGKILQKLGMVREGTLRRHIKKWDRYEDIVCYGILREEYG